MSGWVKTFCPEAGSKFSSLASTPAICQMQWKELIPIFSFKRCCPKLNPFIIWSSWCPFSLTLSFVRFRRSAVWSSHIILHPDHILIFCDRTAAAELGITVVGLICLSSNYSIHCCINWVSYQNWTNHKSFETSWRCWRPGNELIQSSNTC